MSSTSQPYGLKPVYNPGGTVQSALIALPNGIASGYSSAIGLYSPVTFATDGTLTIAATNADTWGVFMGCEFYQSGTTLEQKRINWLASATYATGTMIAYYIAGTTPGMQFQIQANGSLAQTSILDQADYINPGTVNALGFSSTQISTTLAGAGVQKQLRILGLAGQVDNAWGDSYTDVIVQNARSQIVSNKVAV